MSALNRPLSLSATVALLAIAGLATWNELRHRGASLVARPPVATTPPAKPLDAAPPGPVFPGFDPAAVQERLQGLWLVEGEDTTDEILEISGASLTEHQGDRVTHASMQVSSPCSVSLKRDGDAISRSFALTTTGARFDFQDGKRLGKDTVICDGADLYIASQDHCAAWKHVEDGTWDPIDGDCSFTANVLSEPDGTVVLLDEADGVLYSKAVSKEAGKRFARLEDAEHALAASQAERRKVIADSQHAKELVASANTDPWLAVGVHVRFTTTVIDVDHKSGIVALADSAKHSTDGAYVQCVVLSGHTVPRRGQHVAVEGKIGEVSATDKGWARIDLVDCVVRPM